uniref:hypothetical protein n=1 Tax=Proteus mirabilis TaxID=584 RepID=UPI0034D5A14A
MEISKDSYSQVENVLDFITLLVFKDEVEADKNETMASSRNSMEYLGAYFKTDDLSDQEREIIIRNYKELNPYYDNLWKKYDVPPYISRQAKDFDIIYEPVNMLTVNSVLSNYRIVYKRVLTYFYFSTYSKANESKENYRNFCLFMINMMAFMNYMNKWMENPYDVDMMSEKLVDRFMASFGITYFSNAPLHYKRRIAKNMNRLISRKGTDKVIVDILDIFDFNNINIFKYYLVRDETITNSDGSNEVIKNPRFISHNIRIPS